MAVRSEEGCFGEPRFFKWTTGVLKFPAIKVGAPGLLGAAVGLLLPICLERMICPAG